MSGLIKDPKKRDVQLWAPSRVVSVTSGVAWEPDGDDIGFLATVDCNYIITNDSGAQTEIPLSIDTPKGIREGFTYTFDANIELEVM